MAPNDLSFAHCVIKCNENLASERLKAYLCSVIRTDKTDC